MHSGPVRFPPPAAEATWPYVRQLLAMPDRLPEVIHTLLQIVCAVLAILWNAIVAF